MFCVNCGNELNNDDKFCTNCGKRIDDTQNENEIKIQEDTQIKLSVTQKFSYIYMYMPSFIIITAIVIGLGMLWSTQELFWGNVISYVGTALVFITHILSAILTKKQYANCSYEFLSTKMLFKDEYMNKEEKEIKYSDIKEVVMYQSMLQKLYDAGNITIYTNASSSNNGFQIKDVENPKEIYNKIKEII